MKRVISLIALCSVLITVFTSCASKEKPSAEDISTTAYETYNTEAADMSAQYGAETSEPVSQVSEEAPTDIITSKQPVVTVPPTTKPAATKPATTKPTTTKPVIKGDFNFTATDLNGNSVSYSDFADAKLIMVNFWEPWCGPCVGEMPDLEELYEKYKGDGLVILGVFYSFDSESDARSVVNDIGITYPILKGNSYFSKYTTEYVPTTIFVDENGNVITKSPYVGSKSLSEWDNIIKNKLY